MRNNTETRRQCNEIILSTVLLAKEIQVFVLHLNINENTVHFLIAKVSDR